MLFPKERDSGIDCRNVDQDVGLEAELLIRLTVPLHREFIGRGTKGRDAYQAQLWIELRALAWAKHDARERERGLALRERIARAEGRL